MCVLSPKSTYRYPFQNFSVKKNGHKLKVHMWGDGYIRWVHQIKFTIAIWKDVVFFLLGKCLSTYAQVNKSDNILEYTVWSHLWKKTVPIVLWIYIHREVSWEIFNETLIW